MKNFKRIFKLHFLNKNMLIASVVASIFWGIFDIKFGDLAIKELPFFIVEDTFFTQLFASLILALSKDENRLFTNDFLKSKKGDMNDKIK